MATETVVFDTQHEDMIHDVQLDYYGKRLATCSSDGTIRIFEIQDREQKLQTVLKKHTGPVWQVGWAHPKFGTILASCSYDGRVLIWKETETGWEVIKEHAKHQASVNAISWAPNELGPYLACASSDGSVSVLFFNDGQWESSSIPNAHATGVNSVSWAPITAASVSSSTANAAPTLARRLATGGCDNLVKIWLYDQQTKAYDNTQVLDGHTDWVRDVAFAPNIGLAKSYLASCSQDKSVVIWSQDNVASSSSAPLTPQELSADWTRQPLTPQPFADTVWRVSWSLSGNVLAVACGDNKVSLWKESVDGQWECISKLDEAGVASNPIPQTSQPTTPSISA